MGAGRTQEEISQVRMDCVVTQWEIKSIQMRKTNIVRWKLKENKIREENDRQWKQQIQWTQKEGDSLEQIFKDKLSSNKRQSAMYRTYCVPGIIDSE